MGGAKSAGRGTEGRPLSLIGIWPVLANALARERAAKRTWHAAKLARTRRQSGMSAMGQGGQFDRNAFLGNELVKSSGSWHKPCVTRRPQAFLAAKSAMTWRLRFCSRTLQKFPPHVLGGHPSGKADTL